VITVVDGVAWAPHGLPDLGELGADIYLFSLYKTYGPHQGLMVVRAGLLERLGNEGHYFNAGESSKRLVPAGPDHAQVAAARGIAEYFDALDAHHGAAGGPAEATAAGASRARAARVRALLRGAEVPLLAKLLEYLGTRRDVRVLGPQVTEERAATVAFVSETIEPLEIVRSLARRGFMAGNGNFYAVRVLEAMNVNPDRGAIRLSLLHYNSSEEVAGVIEALEQILGPQVAARRAHHGDSRESPPQGRA
jgi:selenocysteine lyase/cysteine desulfurase